MAARTNRQQQDKFLPVHFGHRLRQHSGFRLTLHTHHAEQLHTFKLFRRKMNSLC